MNFFVRARGVYVQAGTPEVAASYFPGGPVLVAAAAAVISDLQPGETAEFDSGWTVHRSKESR
jgi:hypothetical protein